MNVLPILLLETSLKISNIIPMAVYTSDDGLGRKLLRVAGEERGMDKQDQSTTTNYSDGITENADHHVRSPLIRPRRPDDVSDDGGILSVCSLSDRTRRHGRSVPRREIIQPESNGGLLKYILDTLSTRSVSVMSFLLIVVFGIVLTVASNLNTDSKGFQVKPSHVFVYIMFLMTVFVVWTNIAILPQKIKYSARYDGALIPTHLLTGIGIFGTVSAICQMLLFVDFVKCNRHVKNLSAVYGIYPFFKAFFIYFQIYFFYKLSRSGIRDRKVSGGNFFIMVTLATNMCIWGGVFLNDASKDPKMKNVPWLVRYNYGVSGSDPCANATLTSPQAKRLHDIVSQLWPYIAAFSMEYVLLASGLLLHVWQSMKAPLTSQALLPQKADWTLWRLGFILGLLSMPLLFAGYITEIASEQFGTKEGVLYSIECIMYVVLAAFSWYCIVVLNRTSDLVKHARTMQLEIILLAISFIGFPVLDLCCVFASFMEIGNFPASLIAWYVLSSVAELVAVGLQFLFVKKAYEYKLPEVAGPNVRKTAKIIRQFASFALVVNFCSWAAKTYELRRKTDNLTVAEKFYGRYAWFALGHLSYPLCIFFHFHLAICFANVVSFFSQFGPLHKSS